MFQINDFLKAKGKRTIIDVFAVVDYSNGNLWQEFFYDKEPEFTQRMQLLDVLLSRKLRREQYQGFINLMYATRPNAPTHEIQSALVKIWFLFV